MKKRILFVIALLIVAAASNIAVAQSMTDDEIITFVIQEQQRGTSQAQIVTKLIQKGVTIEQIRKVKATVERQKGTTSIGTKDVTGSTSRLRENNTHPTSAQQSTGAHAPVLLIMWAPLKTTLSGFGRIFCPNNAF